MVIPASQALDSNWHDYSLWILAVGSPKQSFEQSVKCTSVCLWVCIHALGEASVCTHAHGWLGVHIHTSPCVGVCRVMLTGVCTRASVGLCTITHRCVSVSVCACECTCTEMSK